MTGNATLCPSEDVLQLGGHPLDSLFKPESVAVVGATDRVGSVGRTLLKNLISNPFGGAVYPVNPKRDQVLGIVAFKSIAACPKRVDVAVIITPAASVPNLIQECVNNAVRHAVIISAGFREVGPEGAKLEEEVKAIAAKGNLRIVGPNCLGLICPTSGLNASFANLMPAAGSVAFISQSGAMITSVLDWSVSQKVGFSAVISIGAMMDMDFSHMINYLSNDTSTKSIVLYMETIGDARRFLSAAREASLTKPIIVIKGGKTDAAAKAAASHTGSLTGSDAVLDAAFKRAGVLRVERVADLFEMADVLSKQPLPHGNRLAILTNAGGPGVLACDALAKDGGALAELASETIERLNGVLPAAWSHANPIDVLGDATAMHYAKSLEVIAEDGNCDGFLVILTPQAMTAPTECATALNKYASISGKPVLASWMGGPDVMEGAKVLREGGIPCYSYPDMACRTFNYMHEYKSNLSSNYERINLQLDMVKLSEGRSEVAQLISGIRSSGRTLLTEAESKQLLRAYGIPVTACEVCQTPAEAAAAAGRIGFPVVVKLNSTTITHKFDVGGVKLNLHSSADLENAFVDMKESVSRLASADGFEGVTVQPMISMNGFEIILGSSIDPQLGPVVLFGMGGSLVEVFKDSALGLPPLNANLARKMLQRRKIFEALKGVRGMKSVDLDALVDVMVRFSILVVDHPEIMECDINPLVASSEGILSLDSRVLLYDKDVKHLPHPAIRPYPYQYVFSHDLPSGSVKVRPILPEDEALLDGFYSQAEFPDGVDPTSPRTAQHSDDSCTSPHRFFKKSFLNDVCNDPPPSKPHPSAERSHLIKLCFADYDRSIVLVAEREIEGVKRILGVGRCTKEHMSDDLTFALQVLPAFRKLGLGKIILQNMIQVSRSEGGRRLKADVHTTNDGALAFLEKIGFSTQPTGKDTLVCAAFAL